MCLPLALPPWYALVGGWPAPARVACMPLLVWLLEMVKGEGVGWVCSGEAVWPKYPPGRSQCKGLIRLDYALVWMLLGVLMEVADKYLRFGRRLAPAQARPMF